MSTATDPTPHAVLAYLEARILDGDTTVTAAALQKARAAVEFAELQATGEQRRADLDAAHAQRAAEDELRRDVAALAAELSRMQSAYTGLVGALRTFAAETKTWDDRRRQLIAQAKVLGIADEADGLVDLSRQDWVRIAADEAAGRYGTTVARVNVNGLSASRRAFHVLHSPKARALIEAEQLAELEQSATVHREREAQRARDREAAAELQQAAARRVEEAAAAKVAAASLRRE